MFAPIQNGTIFDMTLAVILGVILGICMAIAYYSAMLDLRYAPTEKRAYRKLIKYMWDSLKGLINDPTFGWRDK